MRMLALACIPIIGLSGCAMFQKQPEPAQVPQVVAPKPIKKAPVRQKVAPKVKPAGFTPNTNDGDTPAW